MLENNNEIQEQEIDSKKKEKPENPVFFKIDNFNTLNLLKKKTLRFETKKKYKKKLSIGQNYSNSKNGRWTLEEHTHFLRAITKYGTDWKKIEKAMLSKTRTRVQIISHFQKFFKKLNACKDAELGIDFTSKSIVNLEDMISHIKTVNSNYDVVNIFLHFTKDGRFNKESEDIKSENKQINVINQINNIKLNFPLNNNSISNTLLNNVNNNLICLINSYLNYSIINNRILSLYLLDLSNNYINRFQLYLLYNNLIYFNNLKVSNIHNG